MIQKLIKSKNKNKKYQSLRKRPKNTSRKQKGGVINHISIEHVTKFFYKYSNRFLIYNFKYNGKKSFFKQSIDTKKDLEIIKSKLNKKKFYNFTLNTE